MGCCTQHHRPTFSNSTSRTRSSAPPVLAWERCLFGQKTGTLLTSHETWPCDGATTSRSGRRLLASGTNSRFITPKVLFWGSSSLKVQPSPSLCNCRGLGCLGTGTGCSHPAAKGLKAGEKPLKQNLKESFEDGGQKPVPIKMFFNTFYRLGPFIRAPKLLCGMKATV